MIRLHLMTRRCELSAADRELIDRAVARFERRLRHFAPDALDLFLDLERHARREEYRGSVRLDILGTSLLAKRNVAPSLHALLARAFDDLEDKLERYEAKLRRDASHERRRASLSAAEARAAERILLEERELLDRALAGDRAAFSHLVEAELPGLTRTIAQALRDAGRQPSEEEIQHVLADVLAGAFAALQRKPARWSMSVWLAAQVRRQVTRERQPALAQSVGSG